MIHLWIILCIFLNIGRNKLQEYKINFVWALFMKPYPHCINSPDEKYKFEPEQFCFNLTDLNLSDVIKKEIEISAKVLLIKGKQ